jgi:hypothetical protein
MGHGVREKSILLQTNYTTPGADRPKKEKILIDISCTSKHNVQYEQA